MSSLQLCWREAKDGTAQTVHGNSQFGFLRLHALTIVNIVDVEGCEPFLYLFVLVPDDKGNHFLVLLRKLAYLFVRCIERLLLLDSIRRTGVDDIGGWHRRQCELARLAEFGESRVLARIRRGY